jgi:CubicO group peptidase (beta-lactamase class C family)
VSRFEELVEVARAQMDELSVPGVSVGVLFEGEEETAGLGVTSIENPLDVTPDTLFQIGSITKTFVASAIMRLVEAGEVELDAPVRTYLPELRLADEDAASRATVRQLLTHTGGWLGDYFESFGWGDDSLERMVAALAEQPQLTPLGEVWSYNNAAFYIAGRVIEVVTGKTFEDALRELVFDPLGIEDAYFFMDDVITRRFAVGHERDENGEAKVARPWAIGRAAHAAGGIATSMLELLRYARFWIEGGDFLTPASVEEMTRPQVPVGGNIDAVGLAWMLTSIEGVRVIAHGGGTKGQISWLGIAPDNAFAVAILTNYDYGDIVTDRVGDAAFEVYLGVRAPELEPIELDPTQYLGRYESKMAFAELVATEAGVELRLEPKGGFPTPDTPPSPAPPPAPIAFASEDEIFVPEGIWKGYRAVFLRDPAGQIQWLRLGGRVYSPVAS